MRGEPIVVPYTAEGLEIPIPAEVSMWGGPSRFTVRGVAVDEMGYISTALAVTGTIVTTYTAGYNPRLTGKITPSTVELYLTQANEAMQNYLRAAKESGEFDGTDGRDGTSCGFGNTYAFTETLAAGSPAQVIVTASGPDSAKNLEFRFRIPKGDPGTPATPIPGGIKILGHYASLQALQAAVPNPEVGDAYSVGASTPYTMYIFDGVTQAWANYGTIAEGGGGSSITVDDSIVPNSTNPVQSKVIQNYVSTQIPSSLKNPNALTIFGTDYDGSSAVTVTMDSEMSDSSNNAVKNSVIKQYIDGLIGDVNTAIAAIEAIIGGGT